MEYWAPGHGFPIEIDFVYSRGSLRNSGVLNYKVYSSFQLKYFYSIKKKI